MKNITRRHESTAQARIGKYYHIRGGWKSATKVKLEGTHTEITLAQLSGSIAGKKLSRNKSNNAARMVV
jgi:hypothetical protein